MTKNTAGFPAGLLVGALIALTLIAIPIGLTLSDAHKQVLALNAQLALEHAPYQEVVPVASTDPQAVPYLVDTQNSDGTWSTGGVAYEKYVTCWPWPDPTTRVECIPTALLPSPVPQHP